MKATLLAIFGGSISSILLFVYWVFKFLPELAVTCWCVHCLVHQSSVQEYTLWPEFNCLASLYSWGEGVTNMSATRLRSIWSQANQWGNEDQTDQKCHRLRSLSPSRITIHWLYNRTWSRVSTG